MAAAPRGRAQRRTIFSITRRIPARRRSQIFSWKMKTSLAYKMVKSPVGEIKLVASAEALMAVLWGNSAPGHARFAEATEDPSHPVLRQAERQLADYFAGKLKVFSLKLDFTGTDFQKVVWQALLTIPYGETRSYREVAAQIGNPKAVRAAGGAIGRNPISIIAPCHRVLGASGQLTGFAGGLAVKSLLLEIESCAVLKSS